MYRDQEHINAEIDQLKSKVERLEKEKPKNKMTFGSLCKVLYIEEIDRIDLLAVVPLV